MFVDSQLDPGARQRLEVHLADCDFCLGQVAALEQLEELGAAIEVPTGWRARAEAAAKPATGMALGPAWRWAAVAASACVVLAVTLWWRKPQGPPVLPLGPSSPSATSRSAPPPSATEPSPPVRAARNRRIPAVQPEILFPGDRSVTGLSAIRFRWKAVPPALFYEIRLVTAQGDMVWEGRAEGTEAMLPARIQLSPGKIYFAWVVAYLPEGKTVKSATVEFSAQGPN